VNKKSDFYWVYPKAAAAVGIRSACTRYACGRGDYQITTASYVALNYAIAKAVPDEVRANADNPFRLMWKLVSGLQHTYARPRTRVADLTTGGSDFWAYSTTPTVAWTSDTSDPWGDIDSGGQRRCVYRRRCTNVAVMSWDVWRNYASTLTS